MGVEEGGDDDDDDECGEDSTMLVAILPLRCSSSGNIS
jgi:hypothetical protein